MRPRKTETTGSGDLFRARLDQIINMGRGLAHLAEASVRIRVECRTSCHRAEINPP